MLFSNIIKQRRIITAICVLVLIPLGFLIKEYTGPFSHIISDKLAGAFYVIFWCLLLSFFLQRINTVKIVISVVIVTCLLELVQLVEAPVLEMIRSDYIGRALIGSSFSWSDFIFYIIGGVLSYLIILLIKRIKK